ncbi:MAG: DUF1232 domain-containing protein [Planctomycetales bacterium]|nr:DUF1232 domain-containing protein [Planctomycetales bacterium]
MSGFFDTLQTACICLTILAVGFLILLAMPQSRLRSVCLEIGKYLLAFILGLLIISPVDVIPDIVPFVGLGDDLTYLLAAISAVTSARKEHQLRKQLPRR